MSYTYRIHWNKVDCRFNVVDGIIFPDENCVKHGLNINPWEHYVIVNGEKCNFGYDEDGKIYTICPMFIDALLYWKTTIDKLVTSSWITNGSKKEQDILIVQVQGEEYKVYPIHSKWDK